MKHATFQITGKKLPLYRFIKGEIRTVQEITDQSLSFPLWEKYGKESINLWNHTSTSLTVKGDFYLNWGQVIK